jgi:hypothetical protein
MRLVSLAALSTMLLAAPTSATISFTGSWAVAGDASDLSGLSPAFGGNRLSFGSDLAYDRSSGTFWGNTDRGPGGGVISFQPRVHQFGLDIQPDGSVTGFALKKTVTFTDKDGTPFDGLNPGLLNGDKSKLGLSFDPEGIVRLKNGNFLVADEYGPSLYEFDRNGRLVRAFETPENLKPRTSGGTLNYVDGRGAAPGVRVETGRQDNRGFEGLTLSGDGKFAWAVMQDPLMQEGGPGGREGRRSQNVRVVKFDTATGEAVGQYIYQLEALADINGRIPGTAADFAATSQGRNIGLSGIIALPNGKFLVLERDNRGFGVDPVIDGLLPVGTKRVYLVDFTGATDVSEISLAGSNDLPGGVVPATKTLWLDIQAEFEKAGIMVTEKMEGIAFGPNIDGGRAFIVVTDNDFSVTQSGSGEQFDVCTDVTGTVVEQVVLGTACSAGLALIPTYSYVFKVSGDSLWAAGIPEPATWGMLIAGFGLVGSALRRQRRALA